MYYNILIRVCKSLIGDSWGSNTIIQETIKAENKEEVKKILLKKYPSLFQNNKIYTRETKDLAQFFYVLIYPYNTYSISENKKEWCCDFCGKKYPNSIEYIKRTSSKFSGKSFCPNVNPKLSILDKIDFNTINGCLEGYTKHFYENTPEEDDKSYVNFNSKYYIYKITEKDTKKCYIGQTRNEPFFRWWQHLKHSKSPFGIYLNKSKIENWTFEVLDTFSHNVDYNKVLEKETFYIKKYNSIKEGFNKVISKK